MKQILTSLDFAALILALDEDRIDSVEAAQNLNDIELSRLGLSTTGDRIRFREK